MSCLVYLLLLATICHTIEKYVKRSIVFIKMLFVVWWYLKHEYIRTC